MLSPDPFEITPPAPLPEHDPLVRRVGEDFMFFWASHGVGMVFTHLHDSSGGVQGEIHVASSVMGDLHWGRLMLASTSARETLIRKLTQRVPAPWRILLDRACEETCRVWRQGEPMVQLTGQLRVASPDLLWPFLPAGETMVLCGDGGSSKTYLALAWAVALHHNIALPGHRAPRERCSTLYLDWENSHAVLDDRLAKLCAGLEIPSSPSLYYRAMTSSLADNIAEIKAEVVTRQIGCVIVDSFALACGAEPETADSAICAMNALRTLAPATRVVLAHVSKSEADKTQGKSRPYGSVFVQNSARSVWEVRASDPLDDSTLTIGVFHRKTNEGALHPPLGLQWEFAPGVVHLRFSPIAEDAELMGHTGQKYQICALLSTGAKTVAEISETIGISDSAVRENLHRLKNKGKVIRVPSPSKEGVWGLATLGE